MSTIQEFDFSANVLRALLWRNNESVNLEGLVQAKQDYFDTATKDFWESWIVDVFDLRTANEFGLAVWSIILGINITIGVGSHVANSSWGFGSFRKNWFPPAGFSSASSDIALSLEDARIVLRLRYYQLTTNGNVADINLLLLDVFGNPGSSAYVEDNLDMTVTYVFPVPLTSALAEVLAAFDLLPRPSGVDIVP